MKEVWEHGSCCCCKFCIFLRKIKGIKEPDTFDYIW